MILDPIVCGFLAAAVSVPLSQLSDPEARSDRLGLAVSAVMCLLAVLAVGDGVLGGLGAVLSGAYVLLGVVGGLRALRRAVCRPLLQWSEVGLAAAWIWVVGGGVWLYVYAADVSLLGFSGRWALLTAAHFHAAGFGAVTITSLMVRAIDRGHWVIALHPLAFACVAGGLTGSPVFEKIGTVAYVLLFGAQWGLAMRGGLGHRRGGIVVLFALTVPLGTLCLSVDWALGGRHLSLGQMAWMHGVVNALGHGVLGLIGYARMAPRPKTRPLEAPLSQIVASGRLTTSTVDRWRASNPEPVTGLTPDFSRYAGRGFFPIRVDDSIRHFYEHTVTYRIEAVHCWQRGFRLGGAVFHRLSRRWGQMGLPGPDAPAGEMTNALVDIEDSADGRTDVRAWIRTWTRSGETLYVALYSEHVAAHVRYMNIAFPLPGASMMSILKLVNRPDGSLVLTTRRDAADTGDQGVYLRVRGWRPWRLPIDETITVELGAAPGELVARHDMWCLGRLFLVLNYRMFKGE